MGRIPGWTAASGPLPLSLLDKSDAVHLGQLYHGQRDRALAPCAGLPTRGDQVMRMETQSGQAEQGMTVGIIKSDELGDLIPVERGVRFHRKQDGRKRV